MKDAWPVAQGVVADQAASDGVSGMARKGTDRGAAGSSGQTEDSVSQRIVAQNIVRDNRERVDGEQVRASLDVRQFVEDLPADDKAARKQADAVKRAPVVLLLKTNDPAVANGKVVQFLDRNNLSYQWIDPAGESDNLKRADGAVSTPFAADPAAAVPTPERTTSSGSRPDEAANRHVSMAGAKAPSQEPAAAAAGPALPSVVRVAGINREEQSPATAPASLAGVGGKELNEFHKVSAANSAANNGYSLTNSAANKEALARVPGRRVYVVPMNMRQVNDLASAIEQAQRAGDCRVSSSVAFNRVAGPATEESQQAPAADLKSSSAEASRLPSVRKAVDAREIDQLESTYHNYRLQAQPTEPANGGPSAGANVSRNAAANAPANGVTAAADTEKYAEEKAPGGGGGESSNDKAAVSAPAPAVTADAAAPPGGGPGRRMEQSSGRVATGPREMGGGSGGAAKGVRESNPVAPARGRGVAPASAARPQDRVQGNASSSASPAPSAAAEALRRQSRPGSAVAGLPQPAGKAEGGAAEGGRDASEGSRLRDSLAGEARGESFGTAATQPAGSAAPAARSMPAVSQPAVERAADEPADRAVDVVILVEGEAAESAGPAAQPAATTPAASGTPANSQQARPAGK